ncbi:MAG: hypothetical protein DYG89_34905 [Caldilinea sp. CFX5]|nr:hypothetical protein [Caldilinea sp. CFX5]
MFNQTGQRVTNQQNAAGDIINHQGQSHSVLLSELQKLKVATAHAHQQGLLPLEVAADVEDQIVKATQQAEKEPPNKPSLLEHLNTAKSLLESIAAASSIVNGLTTLIQTIHKFF